MAHTDTPELPEYRGCYEYETASDARHVGGAALTVEELAYYGIDYILAYELAGGLGTKGLKMGDFYLVATALVADGTTPHYTYAPLITADETLKQDILKLWPGTDNGVMTLVQAYTGDAHLPRG
jgi:uridine phosphorylase